MEQNSAKEKEIEEIKKIMSDKEAAECKEGFFERLCKTGILALILPLVYYSSLNCADKRIILVILGVITAYFLYRTLLLGGILLFRNLCINLVNAIFDEEDGNG